MKHEIQEILKKIILLICFLLFSLLAKPIQAQSPALIQAQGAKLEFNKQIFVPKGVNHMDIDTLWDKDKTQPGANWISENDFILFKNIGLNTVRLPLKSDYFQSNKQPYRWNENSFLWLDQIISWSKDYGIFLILDMHIPTGGLYQDYQIYPENQIFWEDDWMRGRYVDVWREISKRYSNEQFILGYDLMNEPATLNFNKYERLLQSTVYAIRSNNDKHLVIIQPGMFVESNQSWGFKYPSIQDSQIIRSLHFYQPTDFTLQGAPWLTSNTTTVLTYPFTNNSVNIDWNEDTILDNLELQKNQASENGRYPVLLSEFGTIFTAKHHGQLFWINDVIKAAQKLNMGWLYWYYKGPSLNGSLSVSSISDDMNWPVLHVLRRASKL